MGHLVRRQAGFNRRLVTGRINVEVAVKKQIPDQANRLVGNRRQDLFDELRREHG